MKTRAYFFGNMYLSSIQQGIQAGHVIGEMSAQYWGRDDDQANLFYQWARNDKVMILLNAGYGENIENMVDLFEGTNDYDDEPRLSSEYDNLSPYPFAYFRESDEALSGALTSFGCILTEKIYEGQNVMRKVKRLRPDDYKRLRFEKERILTFGDGIEHQYTEWEVFLMKRLGTFGMAK